MSNRVGRFSELAYKKESAWGTYIAPDKKLRMISEGLNTIVDPVEIDNLIGKEGVTDVIKVGENANGVIESKCYPDEVGEFLHGCLGDQSAVTDPYNSVLVVSYNGTEIGARLTKTGSNLLAEIHNGTTWVADTNFNTTGTIDLSTASFDTMTELQLVINGYTGWQAYLFGLTSDLTINIPDFTATNLKNESKEI